jgi:hypothetical protein
VGAFTDEQRQKSIETRRRNREEKVYDVYLAGLEEGMLLTAAAQKANLTLDAIRKRRSVDPVFAENERLARAVGAEPVEAALREAALNGNVPAAVKWLERYSAETWAPLPKQSEINVNVEHSLAPATLDLIALEHRLRERKALARGDDPDVIDV